MSKFMLASKRLFQIGRNSINPLQRAPEARSDTTRLQGDVKWEQIWQSVVEAAEKYALTRIRLNLHIARDHEDFFGSWESEKANQRDGKEESHTDWTIVRPLVVDGVSIGRIVAEGKQNDTGIEAQIGFIEFSEQIEMQIRELTFESRQAVVEIPNSVLQGSPEHFEVVSNA